MNSGIKIIKTFKNSIIIKNLLLLFAMWVNPCWHIPANFKWKVKTNYLTLKNLYYGYLSQHMR